MKTILSGLAFATLLALAPIQGANSQDAPDWLKQIFPQKALKSGVDQMNANMDPGDLDGKPKQLIALGVAAQIPCQYCVYAHTVLAKKAGATDAQIKETIAAAAETRELSTMLNGIAYDMADLKKQIDASVAPQ